MDKWMLIDAAVDAKCVFSFNLAFAEFVERDEKALTCLACLSLEPQPG